jgi:hypothetical protein
MLTQQGQLQNEQKRAHLRRMLQVPASVRRASDELPWQVRLIDIGRAGVAFVSAAPMDVTEAFVLSFQLPGNPIPILLHGRVVYAAPFGRVSAYRIGARFGQVGDEIVARLVDFITAANDAASARA